MNATDHVHAVLAECASAQSCARCGAKPGEPCDAPRKAASVARLERRVPGVSIPDTWRMHAPRVDAAFRYLGHDDAAWPALGHDYAIPKAA
ncbi:hypothetical protein ACGFOM_18145 [Streptomyces sp. NPDC048594]|uniref:hypothetical protein n=1 Tax=Streptomyces sp. NPDC048594 TaxID=3365575 RepID=UPI0037178CD7